MFSFFLYVFIFAAIAILFLLIAVVSFLSRGQKKSNMPKEDPNVIDVQAIDVDDPEQTSATDLLLKP